MRALALSPAAGELGGVPVDFVEQMGSVHPAGWAVAVGGPLHVVLVVGQAGSGVPARGEVDFGSEGRSIAVAVLVGEPNTGAAVVWILDTDAVETVRVDGVQGSVGVGAWARPLDGLWDAVSEIEDGSTSGCWWGSQAWAANDHPVTRLEGGDLVGGSFEAVTR